MPLKKGSAACSRRKKMSISKSQNLSTTNMTYVLVLKCRLSRMKSIIFFTPKTRNVAYKIGGQEWSTIRTMLKSCAKKRNRS